MVVCTHQRLAALRETLPRHLAVRGIDEVVVVVDGSTDGTLEHLATIGDERLRVVAQPRGGQPLARRAGIETSRGDWVFLIDDDDIVLPDHVEILAEVARERGAAIVGSPRLYVPEERLAEAVARERARPVAEVTLDTSLSRFPAGDVETPFISSTALVSRRVFERANFDPDYRGNAWREETDFFVSAAKAGFKVVLTPRTFGFCPQLWPGGHRRSWAWYTWWCWRNNGRFIWKHRRWLRAHGVPAELVRVQLGYAARLLGRPVRRWLTQT
jgi:GT2 family glycosyltransferase